MHANLERPTMRVHFCNCVTGGAETAGGMAPSQSQPSRTAPPPPALYKSATVPLPPSGSLASERQVQSSSAQTEPSVILPLYPSNPRHTATVPSSRGRDTTFPMKGKRVLAQAPNRSHSHSLTAVRENSAGSRAAHHIPTVSFVHSRPSPLLPAHDPQYGSISGPNLAGTKAQSSVENLRPWRSPPSHGGSRPKPAALRPIQRQQERKPQEWYPPVQPLERFPSVRAPEVADPAGGVTPVTARSNGTLGSLPNQPKAAPTLQRPSRPSQPLASLQPQPQETLTPSSTQSDEPSATLSSSSEKPQSSSVPVAAMTAVLGGIIKSLIPDFQKAPEPVQQQLMTKLLEGIVAPNRSDGTHSSQETEGSGEIPQNRSKEQIALDEATVQAPISSKEVAPIIRDEPAGNKEKDVVKDTPSSGLPPRVRTDRPRGKQLTEERRPERIETRRTSLPTSPASSLGGAEAGVIRRCQTLCKQLEEEFQLATLLRHGPPIPTKSAFDAPEEPGHRHVSRSSSPCSSCEDRDGSLPEVPQSAPAVLVPPARVWPQRKESSVVSTPLAASSAFSSQDEAEPEEEDDEAEVASSHARSGSEPMEETLRKLQLRKQQHLARREQQRRKQMIVTQNIKSYLEERRRELAEFRDGSRSSTQTPLSSNGSFTSTAVSSSLPPTLEETRTALPATIASPERGRRPPVPATPQYVPSTKDSREGHRYHRHETRSSRTSNEADHHAHCVHRHYESDPEPLRESHYRHGHEHHRDERPGSSRPNGTTDSAGHHKHARNRNSQHEERSHDEYCRVRHHHGRHADRNGARSFGSDPTEGPTEGSPSSSSNTTGVHHREEELRLLISLLQEQQQWTQEQWDTLRMLQQLVHGEDAAALSSAEAEQDTSPPASTAALALALERIEEHLRRQHEYRRHWDVNHPGSPDVLPEPQSPYNQLDPQQQFVQHHRSYH
eukprot:TRINITY_DN2814_c0_g1_i2.p1 TRINITY_DN2814_c0_g1~~TRINITY_DN2814_c0_g1_i2.p1  ORF type:complete len:948 (-),score=94.14 TRINITY_DN2814_c0_g1_i2:439-3282(-)